MWFWVIITFHRVIHRVFSRLVLSDWVIQTTEGMLYIDLYSLLVTGSLPPCWYHSCYFSGFTVRSHGVIARRKQFQGWRTDGSEMCDSTLRFRRHHSRMYSAFLAWTKSWRSLWSCSLGLHQSWTTCLSSVTVDGRYGPEFASLAASWCACGWRSWGHIRWRGSALWAGKDPTVTCSPR